MADEDEIVVEKGADPSRLIIAFTGAHGNLSLNPFDFWDLTRTLGYSRVLLRDGKRTWYLNGTGDDARNFPQLVEVLREQIRTLGPDHVTILANSMGGFAGLLAGHMLGVDEVHAFGPIVTLHPLRVARERGTLWRFKRADLVKVYLKQFRHRRLLDLPTVLKRHNGKTTFYAHFCHGSEVAKGAPRLVGLPGVHVLTCPPNAENSVVQELAKSGYLSKFLRLEPPETPLDLHTRIYGPQAGEGIFAARVRRVRQPATEEQR